MAFDSDRILIAGLIEIDLPSKTVRLCDGAWVEFPAVGRFESSDDDFGTIGGVEAVTEATGDEAVGGKIILLPPSLTASGDLFMPTAQGRSIRGWFAEVDRDTNQVIGTPEQLFAVQTDLATIVNAAEQRSVEIDFVDGAEKLWMVSEGNVLAPAWHKRIFPGETGLDAATSSPVSVPWGINGPARGAVLIGSGGGYGGYNNVYEAPVG